MSSNTLYVSPKGNDEIAAIGNPTRTFTFRGAIQKINSIESTAIWLINVATGTYTLKCPEPVLILRSAIITGAGSKRTIINAYSLVMDPEISVTLIFVPGVAPGSNRNRTDRSMFLPVA